MIFINTMDPYSENNRRNGVWYSYPEYCKCQFFITFLPLYIFDLCLQFFYPQFFDNKTFFCSFRTFFLYTFSFPFPSCSVLFVIHSILSQTNQEKKITKITTLAFHVFSHISIFRCFSKDLRKHWTTIILTSFFSVTYSK